MRLSVTAAAWCVLQVVFAERPRCCPAVLGEEEPDAASPTLLHTVGINRCEIEHKTGHARSVLSRNAMVGKEIN
ncbi:unnamed protein product [Lampetra planeri]